MQSLNLLKSSLSAAFKSIKPKNSVTFQTAKMTTTLAGQELDSEQVKMMDERIIVVDEQDNTIRPATKKECHLVGENGSLILHRAFSVFLFNEDNKLLVQKRASHKITFPNQWANTCCSHPLHNDSELPTENGLGVKRAAIRKLEQELGLSQSLFKPEDFTFLTRIHYKAYMADKVWGEHEVDYCLFVKKNLTIDQVLPNLNANEISDAKFLSQDEVYQLLEDDKAGKVEVTPWFKIISEKFLKTWWSAFEKNELDSVVDTKTVHKLF